MTIHPQMDWHRYLLLLDAYGADFERWPPGDRPAAEELHAASEAARQTRREAQALDRLLDQSPSAEPSDVLKARIHRIPDLAPRPSHGTAPSTLRRTLAPWLALAAAALLGIATGSFVEPSAEQPSASAAAMTSEDWDALTELAFASDLESEQWP